MKKTLIQVCLASFVCATFIANAMGSNNVNKGMIKSTLESSFSVINNIIEPIKADLKTCKTDNDYMLSAFKVKNIAISDLDYKVEVSRKIYSNKSIDGELEFFHYEIAFDDFYNVMKKSFSAAKGKDFITTYISLSKAPTKCYAFEANNKMNLICHYGFKEQSAIPDIISKIKG